MDDEQVRDRRVLVINAEAGLCRRLQLDRTRQEPASFRIDNEINTAIAEWDGDLETASDQLFDQAVPPPELDELGVAAGSGLEGRFAHWIRRIVCGLPVCDPSGCRPVAYRSFVQRFGQRIRALRLSRGLSQEALADAARLHRTHISLIERGQRAVRLETIAALAVALGVQPSELMPRLDGRRD